MGLFDIFKKKDCEICGKEVGMLGYKKLEDGEICRDCVKLLSPWFEDRRHSTVAQIKEQLVYREQNAKEHENFTISRKIGDEEYIMYIEEVGGVPTRFFVTNRSDYKEENPDIISFRDVASSVTDIDVRDDEIKQKDQEGNWVSYNPRRFRHHHDFFIKMEIRNNPYFDNIKFRINGSDITLETVGDIGGSIGGAALAGLLQGVGVSTAGVRTNNIRNSSEYRRYEECRMICEKIQQAVEDGKRGAVPAGGDPVQMLIRQIHTAPDMETVTRLVQTVAMMTVNLPNKDSVMSQVSGAMAEAQMRFTRESAGIPVPAQETVKPKFCPNCGTPADGGKFCQSCGSRL